MDIKSNLQDNSKEEFFKLMLFFKNANYKQKLDVMKKCWGNIITTTTINYAEGNSVTIGFDSDNKYYFDFNCHEWDIDTLAKIFPECIEAILNKDIDAIKVDYPEIHNLSYIPTDDETVEQTETKTIKEETVDVTYKYLNVYNNINISARNKSGNKPVG